VGFFFGSFFATVPRFTGILVFFTPEPDFLGRPLAFGNAGI
jgi:hypothetical protein